MKQYSVNQLQQILDYSISKSIISPYDKNEIQKFINLLSVGELKLLPPRDKEGHFLKVVTNEDILEAVKLLVK